MAKPSITLRDTKGSALTYAELDQNFTNLKDATVTLTAGSGGTAVTADLNGTITLVAGTNITLTGDNTAKTITITSSSGSGSGTVNSGNSGNLAYYPSTGTTVDDTTVLSISSGNVVLGGDLNVNGKTISSGGISNIIVDDDINFPSGTGPFVPGSGELLCRGGTITLQTTNDPGISLSGISTGTPSNTSTPTGYIKVAINGTTRYIPYFT